ncbi:amino acid ABC transporter substrate-binding protein [Herbaspirillum rhizosphaerae]|uniref:amino acid ABC transporter substrate-binding protein n=1 Tax=Herbaspirillum rhizosphaerae TaxID=346179 RepID=UPI00067C0729|nr:amino acid ABC transporter substrate-binding protein [Herbaspirillum rhizosphaerae]
MTKKSVRQIWCGWGAVLALSIGMSLPVHAEGMFDKVRRTNTFVIAYLNGTMPFAFVGDDKQVTGYAIDLCRRIAEGIRKDFKLPQMQVQFMEVDTVTRFIALDQGKADLECSTSTNNAERRKIVNFTVPHFFASVRMLVKANSGIHSWEDLRGKTVVVPRNTPMVKQIEERSKIRSLDIKVVEVAFNEEAFDSVEKGKADAFVMEDVLLRRYLLSVPHPERYTMVGESLSLEPYGIMMRKGDPEFKRYVDLQMVKIVRSGEIFKLYDRWFMQPISATIPAMNMPMGYLLRDTLRYPTDKVADE